MPILTIDTSPLSEMPLHCLKDFIEDFHVNEPASAPFAVMVIRYVAVSLICGDVVPPNSNEREAVRRGFAMLALLRAWSTT